jgi:hypothetical protein
MRGGVVLVVQEQGASSRALSAATSHFALRTQHKVRVSKDASPDYLAGQHPPNSHEWFMGQLDSIWERLFPAEQQRIVRLLIEKVIVSPSDLEVRFRPNGIEVLALELQPEPAAEAVKEAVA